MARPKKNAVYGARQLAFGCKDGRDVWDLQVKLIGWGSGSDNDGIGNVMDPVRLTGVFDATTRDAVMRFQKGHKLPITGTVDGVVYRAIDREAALHPVMLHSLRCPCVTGANDGAIPCRCTKHVGAGKCTGFGTGRFADTFLLTDKKLADDTKLKDEKLDVYDMEEYAGMDRAVIWAVRALVHRSLQKSNTTTYKPIQIAAGYRCWEDNYHNTDDIRWHHRKSTFHFGKAIEFYLLDYCSEQKWSETAAGCAQCEILRRDALEKCGFQLRWQQPGRGAVAEGGKAKTPPANPFAVHLDTVRMHPRKKNKLEYKDQFAKTDKTASEPLYANSVVDVSYPLALDDSVTDAWPLASVDDAAGILAVKRSLDPQFAASEDFFRNTETGAGGYFPLGVSRMWHGGIHLYADEATPIHAIADGEVVGCRAGEDESQANGSRNFVLLRHTIKGEGSDKWKDKTFWSLYMHLDGEKPKVDANVRWRKELFERGKKCVEALVPTPILQKKVDKLIPLAGLAVGDTKAVTGAEVLANTVDKVIPDTWKMIAVDGMPDHYVFTTQDAEIISEIREAIATVDDGKVKGLEKPIRVSAGEVIGYVGKTPTADPAKKLGAFFHLETFSDAKLPVKDFVDVEVTGADKMADRKEAIEKLATAKLFPKPPDGVLTTEELKALYLYPPYSTALRSAAVKMPSAWSVDWKTVLPASKTLGFLKDADTKGDDWKSYSWWDDVKAGKGPLPADNTAVFHYHPIALILQLAYR